LKKSGTRSTLKRYPNSELYSVIIKELLKNPDVKPSEKKGFGSYALWANGKIFVLLSSKGEFVAKLPRERVDELASSGLGKRWDPRNDGRLMKEWVTLEPKDSKNWLPVAREALQFVRSRRWQEKGSQNLGTTEDNSNLPQYYLPLGAFQKRRCAN
jgi:hypothetical protein